MGASKYVSCVSFVTVLHLLSQTFTGDSLGVEGLGQLAEDTKKELVWGPWLGGDGTEQGKFP